MNSNVNCLKCKHYTITWNPKAPKACKLLGFKSAAMPSAVAYKTTGKPCEGFELKHGKKANNGAVSKDSSAAAQGVIYEKGGNT